jgi:protein SCO1
MRAPERKELSCSKQLVFVGLALALCLGASACGGGGGSKAVAQAPASRFAGSKWPGGSNVADFALRDQQGRLVRLSAERGRFVIVTFLYTHCPDVCPLIAERLNEALRRLGPARRGVRVLAVSVDPKGDTPAAVRRFVRVHRLVPQFRYLIGSRAELRRVWHAYFVAPQPVGGGVSLHSAYELLIDRSGRPRLSYDTRVKAADVVHDLRLLGVG